LKLYDDKGNVAIETGNITSLKRIQKAMDKANVRKAKGRVNCGMFISLKYKCFRCGNDVRTKYCSCCGQRQVY